MKTSRAWKGLLHDLVTIRRSELQIPHYISVITGLRRSLDDWIPVDQISHFQNLMEKIGLVVQIDCIFKPIRELQKILGVEIVPTTQAIGLPFSKSIKYELNCSAHVIFPIFGRNI
ncbi:hypothetical protein [Candidatus Nitrosocosmicus sp. R]